MTHSETSAQIRNEKNILIGRETIAYYDNGEGEITLLFIHGAFINKEYWNEQLATFSNKFRVIALDLAGHGNSTYNGNDWTFEKYGHDLIEFLIKLSLTNVIIIGHSNGSDIMLEAVTQNSDQII